MQNLQEYSAGVFKAAERRRTTSTKQANNFEGPSTDLTDTSLNSDIMVTTYSEAVRNIKKRTRNVLICVTG